MKELFKGCNQNTKNKLFALWMSKERGESLRTLDILTAMDDEWQRVYDENRIKKGWAAARLLANEWILKCVYG